MSTSEYNISINIKSHLLIIIIYFPTYQYLYLLAATDRYALYLQYDSILI